MVGSEAGSVGVGESQAEIGGVGIGRGGGDRDERAGGHLFLTESGGRSEEHPAFGVEEFSLDRLQQLDRDKIELRVEEFKGMCKL